MKIRLATLAIGAALALSTAVPAFAAPGTGDQVQTNHDQLALFYSGANDVGQVGTIGGAIAAGFLGNTSNDSPTSNGVLPSLAPGRWVCVYEFGTCVDRELGTSWGQFLSPLVKGQGQP